MIRRLICFVLPLILLSGCAPSYRIENQAHAVSMGIDLDGGIMTVIVQVPNLGAASQKEGGTESSNYQIYTAQAENFEIAYNILQSTLPQQLNLTHLKTIVVSRAFAQSDLFKKTIDTFMNVFLVTGSANMVVTEKSAKLMIENQKPHIGIRLSITIPSMLSYHAQNGYIPLCTLSKLYAGLKGRYSTALCPLSDTGDDQSKKDDPFMPGSIPREGDNKNEYMGAALFDRLKMVGTFSGYEMQMAYFLKDEGDRICDFASPIAMRLSTRKKREAEIKIEGDEVRIKVTLHLDVATLFGQTDLKAIEENLKRDFENVINKCKALGVEPFGFAQSAAKEFKDNRSYEDFDWLSKFRNAKIDLNIRLNSEN